MSGWPFTEAKQLWLTESKTVAMGIYDREYLRDPDRSRGPTLSLSGWSASKSLALVIGLFWLYELIAGAMPEADRLVLSRSPDGLIIDTGLLTYGLLHFGSIAALPVLFAALRLAPIYEENHGPWRTLALFVLGQVAAGFIWGALPAANASYLYGGFGGAAALAAAAMLTDRKRRLFASWSWLSCEVGAAIVAVASIAAVPPDQSGLTRLALPLAGAAAGAGAWLLESAWQSRTRARPARRAPAPSELEQPESRPDSLRVQAEKADAVLAKLHEHGRDSLDPEEEKILEEYSLRLRGEQG